RRGDSSTPTRSTALRRAAPTSTSTAPTVSTSTSLPSGAAPCGKAARAPAHYQHVVWIWMENHTWGSVIGDPAAPYIGSLARQCATATDHADVGSPSLPNYLGATSGSTQGIADDGDPPTHAITADT